MGPQLRRPLFIVLTAVAVALAVWIALRHVDPDEGNAYVLGGVAGRLLLALVVVLVVRLIVRRTSDRPDLVSFPAVLCAAAVLGLVLTAASVGSRERQREQDFRQAISDTASCTEVEGDPLLRVRDPDQQRDFVGGFRESAEQQGAEFSTRRLAGRDVSIAELQGVTIVAGPIDCGAVGVSANTTSRAQAVWTMLAGLE